VENGMAASGPTEGEAVVQCRKNLSRKLDFHA